MALLAAGGALPYAWAYPARAVATFAALLVFSRPVLKLRPAAWLGSIGLGVAVFAVWIAPGLIFDGYRHHWLFENALTGFRGGPAQAAPSSVAWTVVRVFGSALVIPAAEELFWRGWLMRWLISPRFQTVPPGTYRAGAFWLTAILFASEHGAYWDVGLAAGLAYNWWMVRTKSLADCILAHAVTNACLAAYVLAFADFQYWT